MALKTGMVLPRYRPLVEILAPLKDVAKRCFWLVDVQCGVFDTWIHLDEYESLLETLYWEVQAFKNSSTLGLRPRSLPRLAPHMNVDEWSYYIAIDRPEAEAMQCAEAFAKQSNYFSPDFLEHLDDVADLFICHVDGWWEFYCGREDWYRQLRTAWPDIRERGLSEAGKPYESTHL